MTRQQPGIGKHVWRGIRLGLAFFAVFALVHAWRNGHWHQWPEDLGWAIFTAAAIVLSQRWHARRGQSCAMCVDSTEDAPPARDPKGGR
jgi:hypothetical protein